MMSKDFSQSEEVCVYRFTFWKKTLGGGVVMNQPLLFGCWFPLLMVMCLGLGGCKSYQKRSSPSSSTSETQASTKFTSSETQQEGVASASISKDDAGACGLAIYHLCNILFEQGQSVDGGIFKRRLLAAPRVCQEEIRQAFNQVYGEGEKITSKEDSYCFMEVVGLVPSTQ